MQTKIDYKREWIAGLTTFLTMSYIVVVNPAILATEGTGMVFGAVLTATVLLCFISTLLMGWYAKLPFAVAPGMGINAFFTYSIILGKNIPWQTALGMVFWSGVLFLLISVTPLREKIALAIPRHLRQATTAGIGIFLTFIGLKNAAFIAPHPVTFVQLGPLDHRTWLSFLGLGLMVLLIKQKNSLAFLIGILGITLPTFLMGHATLPTEWIAAPNFSDHFLKMDIWAALQPALLPAIISMMFTDLFDSLSTFVSISSANQMIDQNGNPKNLRQGLIVDSWATLMGGPLGTSAGTAYLESAAGIEAGGRTGWTAIFCALLFLPCLFFAPILNAIPSFATAPVLILIGALMFKSALKLELEKMEDLIPAFLTVTLIPLTFSITQGILWGLFSHLFLYLLVGRKNEIKPMTAVIGILAAILLGLESQH